LPVVAGPQNIARAQYLVKGLKVATAELGVRAQAEKDGPGSKTWQQIADEFGCSVLTIHRAREAAGLKDEPRSREISPDTSDDLEDEPEHVESETVPPDPEAETHEAELIDEPEPEEPAGCPIRSWPAQLKGLRQVLNGFEANVDDAQAADVVKLLRKYLAKFERKANA